MNKTLLILSIFSGGALAHGHSPQKMDKYVTDSLFKFEFTIKNGFSKYTCYDIEINGEIKPMMRTCLASGAKKTLSVWLESEANIKTQNFVCSISDTGGNIRTKMCSDVLTLFPAKYLGID